MDYPDAGLRQIAEITDAFRIAPPHDDHHRGLVDYPSVRQFAPFVPGHLRLDQTVGVALDGQDCDVRLSARHYLIGYDFGTRVRGLKGQLLPGLLLPLPLVVRQNRGLKTLLDHAEAVNSDCGLTGCGRLAPAPAQLKDQ